MANEIERLTEEERWRIEDLMFEATRFDKPAVLKALRIIDALTAELEAAERKAESWERGHDYAWAEKVKAEARVEALQARVAELETQERNAGKLAVAHLERAMTAESELAQMRGRVERATCMLNGPHSVTAVIGVLRGR